MQVAIRGGDAQVAIHKSLSAIHKSLSAIWAVSNSWWACHSVYRCCVNGSVLLGHYRIRVIPHDHIVTKRTGLLVRQEVHSYI